MTQRPLLIADARTIGILAGLGAALAFALVLAAISARGRDRRDRGADVE